MLYVTDTLVRIWQLLSPAEHVQGTSDPVGSLSDVYNVSRPVLVQSPPDKFQPTRPSRSNTARILWKILRNPFTCPITRLSGPPTSSWNMLFRLTAAVGRFVNSTERWLVSAGRSICWLPWLPAQPCRRTLLTRLAGRECRADPCPHPRGHVTGSAEGADVRFGLRKGSEGALAVGSSGVVGELDGETSTTSMCWHVEGPGTRVQFRLLLNRSGITSFTVWIMF